MKKKRSEKDTYEALFYEANKCKDVFDLQNDLLRIKKILALLITPK